MRRRMSISRREKFGARLRELALDAGFGMLAYREHAEPAVICVGSTRNGDS